MKALVLLAALVAALVSTAHADDDGTITGLRLAELAVGFDRIEDRVEFMGDDYSEKDIVDAMLAVTFMAYIRGINDVTAGDLYCPVETVSGNQITKVVSKYVKDHPERLHEQGALLAIDAMAEGFPCAASTSAAP